MTLRYNGSNISWRLRFVIGAVRADRYYLHSLPAGKNIFRECRVNGWTENRGLRVNERA